MRFLYAIWADIRFQIKQGFYLVYVLITIMYLILLSFLPEELIVYRRNYHAGESAGSIIGFGGFALADN